MVQYGTVQYSRVVILKNSFQFFILNSQEPFQNMETKVQYSMSLYHAVMYCTKGVRGQKVPRVSEDKRCQGCQSSKGAKGVRG